MNSSAIHFHYTDQRFHFTKRTELKAFLLKLAKAEGQKVGGINYIFCSDAYLLEINQQHLNHDTYTDIITFPYNAPGAPIESDIYISIDRVRENAQNFAVPFAAELYRVMFHGLLHLCGYKDKSKVEQAKMREREDYWLKRYTGSTWNKG
ncbi:rRNA maturation RNase YbeY [Flaviaesturariibacter aridisoli]|uniref:Endoribonuclease YbeY n=1 Tax=Flaviaesturariibacter aridisoli TaxID=2545761 RepID=A0A4R4DZW0_9BACT|nr:rRNA maturation RNase YbeY [Flaviaesturariibacter aridisoli]TCZ70499.1 rRNA maturation RNase YbeY [Flaviaesturariibacter aridisoli]